MQYSNPESSPRLTDLFSLKGRTALVIGGAGLLGGQISYALAEMGAELIIASRNEVHCGEFVETLKQQFPEVVVHVLVVDITNPASIKALLARVGKITGGVLDIVAETFLLLPPCTGTSLQITACTIAFDSQTHPAMARLRPASYS